MNIKTKVGFKGIYSFKAVNVKTNEERYLGESPNLITDSGLDLIATGTLAVKCVVGTSSTPPKNTDTGLGNQIAQTTQFHQVNNGHWETGVNTIGTPFYWGRNTFRFAQGVAAGNLTEVGIYGQTYAGRQEVLFSRALIVDALGRPTTLSILEDEYLDVTYELRIYPYTEDSVSTAESGDAVKVQHTCTARAASTTSSLDHMHFVSSLPTITGGYNFFFNEDDIKPHTGAPANGHAVSARVNDYVPGSKTLTFIASVGLDHANYTHGIKSLTLLTSKGRFQIGLQPPILKDNFTITGAEIDITWDRYEA